MMKSDRIALMTAGATLMAAMATAQVAPLPTATPAAAAPALPTLPAAPAAPAAGVPVAPVAPGAPAGVTAAPVSVTPAVAAVTVPGVTTTNVTTTLPAVPGVAPAVPGVAPMAAVPTPPPLGNLSAEAATATGETTSAVSAPAAPSQLYTFLFIDDPDYGVVRQKFNADVAEKIKQQEIERLRQKRMQGQNPAALGGNLPLAPGAAMDPALMGGGIDPTLADPALMGDLGVGGGAAGAGIANTAEAIRAAAEWDFYYGQMEMYDRYVREKLIPNAEQLPELTYDAANALQERQDLFDSFQEAAITQSNEDDNDNRAFYERLQKREDRRIAYYQWVMHKQNEVAEWAEVWARKVYGTRWADGEEVRVDDWYYGTDFNSAKPVLVTMDDRQYIVSKQPVEHLQQGQLNVISTNLTPYDLIDNDGYLKNPVMETLRGTLVIPPVAPVYSTGASTGTIEIVNGEGAE